MQGELLRLQMCKLYSFYSAVWLSHNSINMTLPILPFHFFCTQWLQKIRKRLPSIQFRPVTLRA